MRKSNMKMAHAGLITPVYRRSQRNVAVLTAVFVLLAVVLGARQAPAAEENLRLMGVVKSVNQAAGTVYVEVTSKSCPGMKAFGVDRPDKIGMLEDFVGTKVAFFIDRGICNDRGAHTILLSRGIRK